MAVEANYVSAGHENKKQFVFNENTIISLTICDCGDPCSKSKHVIILHW